jgi:signal transduction histidine kinase/ActR/RegA family two-component response regulator
MKLRTHYLLLAFSILVPAAVFCSIALNLMLNAQRDSVTQRIEESARLSAMVIDADIDRAQSVLQALSGSQALALGDLARFDAEARAANAGAGAWMIMYDDRGQQLINTRHPFGRPLPKRRDRAQVEQLFSSGKWNVSGMRWGDELKNNFVMVELPVTLPSGMRYIVAQAFSPAFFARSFAGRAIPLSWMVAVLDGDGTIIAHRQLAEQVALEKAAPGLLKQIRSASSGALKHVTGEGTEVYAAFTHSALSDWSIVMGAPVEEIDAAVWHGVGAIAFGLGIAILAALTLTIFTGRRLVQFAASAAQAARRLGRGQQVASLAPSGIRELDDLNESIIDASGRLRIEMDSRSLAERERNELLVLEKNARARAEEQNAAKDEFLAMLGHELRNPLSAVANAVYIIDSGQPVSEHLLGRARAVLRRQTEHLRKLVDDLLEVNRALMGKLTLHMAPVDLGDAVRHCVDTLQAGGRTDGFALQVETAPALVNADLTRLVQIVDNILDNALKYTPAGGRIEVAVRHSGGQAEFVVRDSGIGIAPELLPKVFNIFAQGKQSLQRDQGGLGIGLSLVRQLVEMHGGTVEIVSEGTGRGATVTIRLPLLAAVAAAPALPVAASGAPRRVLLIEDNEDAREMMAALLELLSCEVLSASAGPEGIALAAARQPGIAFIDIGLAGMDGYAIARALRADPATAQIELIALTGYGSDDDRRRAFEAGFAHHFTKPITFEKLQLALSSTALSAHN